MKESMYVVMIYEDDRWVDAIYSNSLEGAMLARLEVCDEYTTTLSKVED